MHKYSHVCFNTEYKATPCRGVRVNCVSAKHPAFRVKAILIGCNTDPPSIFTTNTGNSPREIAKIFFSREFSLYQQDNHDVMEPCIDLHCQYKG